MAFITAESGNLNIIGIFENISAQKFPAIHPRFSIVAEVETDEGLHTISLSVKRGEKEMGRMEKTFPGKRHRWIHNFVGYSFEEEGEYKFEIYVDKSLLGSKTISVLKI